MMGIKDKLIEHGETFGKRFVSAFIGAVLVASQANVFALTNQIWFDAINVGLISSILIILYLLTFNDGDEYNKVKMSILSGAVGSLAYYMVREPGLIESIMSGLVTGGLALLLSHLKRRYFWW